MLPCASPDLIQAMDTRPVHPLVLLVLVATPTTACLVTKTGGALAEPELNPDDYAHQVSYHVSCSVSDECRVTYIDFAGKLRAKDVTGEWDIASGANPGTRLWVRAGAGGCPPRPVRVEIVMDGATVAEHLVRPPGGSRCEWILAETEFRVP